MASLSLEGLRDDSTPQLYGVQEECHRRNKPKHFEKRYEQQFKASCKSPVKGVSMLPFQCKSSLLANFKDKPVFTCLASVYVNLPWLQCCFSSTKAYNLLGKNGVQHARGNLNEIRRKLSARCRSTPTEFFAKSGSAASPMTNCPSRLYWGRGSSVRALQEEANTTSGWAAHVSPRTRLYLGCVV